MRDEVKKIIRENSNLSVVKIVATILAAITMSIIVSRLTNFTNNVLLAVIVSFGTLMANEIYRIIVETTALGAKKVIVKPISNLISKDETLKTEENFSEEEIIINESTIQEKIPKTVFGKFFTNISSGIKLTSLFLLVSGLTLISSWAISANSEHNEFYNTYTTVQTQKEQLSDKEKQEIINSAVSQNESEISANAQEIESLKNKNSDLQSQLDSTKNDLANLENELNSLKEKINNYNGTPTDSPTPSPTNN